MELIDEKKVYKKISWDCPFTVTIFCQASCDNEHNPLTTGKPSTRKDKTDIAE